VKCPCGRRKAEALCYEVAAGTANVDCDDVCDSEKERRMKVRRRPQD